LPTIILTSSHTTSPTTREKRAVVLLIAGCAVVQLLCLPGHYLGWAHDDVIYALAARSLLGGAYTLGISPGLPPLTEMTPGWPLLLAPAALVSADSPAGYQLWSWLWLVLCDVLVWLWLRRRLEAGTAAAAAALFALNPLVLSRSGVVMSEVPFLAVMLALLLRLESRAGLRGWQSGLGLGFAWLVRPGALPLLPAVWGWYLWKRRYREAAYSAAVAAAVVLLWKAWVGLAGRSIAEISELAMTLPGQGASGLAGTALWNVSHALTLWGRSALPWAAPPASTSALCVGTVLAFLAAAGLAPFAFRALVVLLSRGPRGDIRRGDGSGRRYETAVVYLAGGILMHAVWPWWYERYLVSFLPFLIWGLASLAAARLPRRWAAAALAAAVLLPLPAQGTRLMRGDRARQRPELMRTYAWIRANTPAYALLTSPFYARDAFYTGRPSVPLPVRAAESAAGDLAGRLRRARVGYLLWQDIPDLGSSLGPRFVWTRRLRRLEAELAAAGLTRVFTDEVEGAVVYLVPPTKVTE